MTTYHRRNLIALSSLAALLALSACGRNDDRTAGQQLDEAIAKTDKAAQNAKVETQAAVDKAESAMQRAAEDTKAAGANAVQQIKDASAKVGQSSSRASADVERKLSDSEITARVNAGLAADKDLSVIRIDVDTRDGVVTLTGPAPTTKAKAHATEVAKAVKGVTSVQNHLTVRAG